MTALDLVPDPMAAPALAWGILAPGGIARRFASEIPRHTQSRILAVASRDAGRAAEFARQFGVHRAYGSYQQLVEDPDVDAVYIASPHSEHAAHAELALLAGKPCLVEKAFAVNAAQARRVFALARSQRLFCMEAMWARFLPHYAALRKLVAQGRLGQILGLLASHAQALDPDPTARLWNPALAGGALLDLGVYPLSLAQMLLGRPDRVQAQGQLTDTGVDLWESITLTYGRTWAVLTNDMAASGANQASIIGSQARVDIPGWFYPPADLELTEVGGRTELWSTKVEGGFQFQAAEAARQIKAGALESDVMPWRDTVEVLETADQVRRQLGLRYPGESE
ncbi:MAG: Gfo/Idh/MocA family oxidoreductase [Propionibacteriaceae bacterium]|jgi:predicted dehydrogenase|nr:Gfo/Idh/MocA family oxidoreductase [Propionibacteriaceae bacterium]